jgi:putative membrane protein
MKQARIPFCILRFCLFIFSLLAPSKGGDIMFDERFLLGIVQALVFGSIGIVLALLGFKIFDWITPRIDVEKELADKNNVAVAIVCAAVILGICYVVAHVVGGPAPN